MDNFFSLGGDSIKSIQIISRMRMAGYKTSIQNIFTHQTIRKLACHLDKLSTSSDQSIIEGKSQLSPIQKWFLNGPLKHKHHYNQAVMLNFSEGISKEVVSIIFEQIQIHHDALRIIFPRKGGNWSRA